jgi:hypothetical protein
MACICVPVPAFRHDTGRTLKRQLPHRFDFSPVPAKGRFRSTGTRLNHRTPAHEQISQACLHRRRGTDSHLAVRICRPLWQAQDSDCRRCDRRQGHGGRESRLHSRQFRRLQNGERPAPSHFQSADRHGQSAPPAADRVDKYNRDRTAPNADQAALRQQAEQINRTQTAGNQAINQILEPARASEIYVKEQIEDKLAAAIQSAMIKNRISILFKPQIVQAMNGAYNLNPAIIAELNALLPSAQLVPPAGWQPRAVRQAQAAQQGQNPSQ